MQEAIKDIKKPENETKSFLNSRTLLIGLGILMAALIILGIINDANAEANPFAPQQSFAILAILAFVGGVLSFLSPCTLPILPAYFAFASQSGRSQIAGNTITFMLGVATVFALFGASASALGSVLRQNQDLILLFGGALVVVFGVMSLLGKGFTGMSADSGGGDGTQATGAGGIFLFGMTFAAGWSSCIGPILGIMLTMAATTASVLRGTILLFIFAIGLGLPLILVSTFIGRASRQSWIWRMLRGKGWFVSVPMLLVAAIWGVATWLILQGVAIYSFVNFPALSGQELTTSIIIGLLVVSLIGSALYLYTIGGGNQKTELHIHSTSLFSGILFLGMGYFMLNGRLSQITAWATRIASESEWYQDLELAIFNLFQ